MENKPLRLGIITNDAQRADSVAQQVTRLGWQLVPQIGQTVKPEWLRQHKFDLMLVDLELPVALSLFKELGSLLPGVPLLALAMPQHFSKLQEAMLAGATDFMAYPVEPTQLMITAQRALQGALKLQLPAPLHQRQTGKLIAIASIRGGVGRSTIAANLAITLRQRVGADVILAETHLLLSHLTLMLNIHPRHTLASLANVEIDRDIVQGVLQAHTSGIRILAAPTELAHIVDLPAQTWQTVLPLLTEAAPYVIADTAAAADDTLSEILMTADEIVLVMTPDILSLRNTFNLVNTLRTETNVRAHLHIVLNREGVRGGLDLAVIEKQLGQKLAVTIPDDAPLATYALNRGVPFIGSHPHSLLSRRINFLADLLIQQNRPVFNSLDKVRSGRPLQSLMGMLKA
jgi:pilus assembly protein CpaE